MSKLLDTPYDLCDSIQVEFVCSDWSEFDLVVGWLLKNGVYLTMRSEDDYFKKDRVVMKGSRPYCQGKMVSNTLAKLFGSVEGEENGVNYQIYFPEMIR